MKLIREKQQVHKLTRLYSEKEMLSFGNFIRDNYYGVGAPKLMSYNPVKYPHATIEEIFIIWCCENDE